jgi:hypothetical protein
MGGKGKGKGKGGKQGKAYTNGTTAETEMGGSPVKADDEMQVVVNITKADVKALLGPKGKMRKLRQDSNVSTFRVNDGDEPTVVIKGKEDNVRSAQEMLLKTCSIGEAPPAVGSPQEPEAETTPVPSEGEKGESSALTGLVGPTVITQMIKKAVALPHFTQYYAPIAGTAVGVPTGVVIGAIVGLPAALFTFGLSIPVCATAGAVVGGGAGAFGGRKVAVCMETYAKSVEA